MPWNWSIYSQAPVISHHEGPRHQKLGSGPIPRGHGSTAISEVSSSLGDRESDSAT